jgi:hypothetical protein
MKFTDVWEKVTSVTALPTLQITRASSLCREGKLILRNESAVV